jgi:hypothetical protein
MGNNSKANRQIFTSNLGNKYEIYGSKYIGYGAWDMSGKKVAGGFDFADDVKVHLNKLTQTNETKDTTTSGDSRATRKRKV